MEKKLLILISATLIIFMSMGCGGTSQDEQAFTPVPVPTEFAGRTNTFGAEAAEAGAEVFRTNCESCHGPQGHGDGFAGQSLDPKPRNLAELQAVVGDDYLFWRIYEGKPGTSMVAWKGILTDEQIWQTVSFIRTLR